MIRKYLLPLMAFLLGVLFFATPAAADTVNTLSQWLSDGGTHIYPRNSQVPSSTSYCLSGDCKSAWPTGFSPSTTNTFTATTTFATSGPICFGPSCPYKFQLDQSAGVTSTGLLLAFDDTINSARPIFAFVPQSFVNTGIIASVFTNKYAAPSTSMYILASPGAPGVGNSFQFFVATSGTTFLSDSSLTIDASALTIVNGLTVGGNNTFTATTTVRSLIATGTTAIQGLTFTTGTATSFTVGSATTTNLAVTGALNLTGATVAGLSVNQLSATSTLAYLANTQTFTGQNTFTATTTLATSTPVCIGVTCAWIRQLDNSSGSTSTILIEAFQAGLNINRPIRIFGGPSIVVNAGLGAQVLQDSNFGASTTDYVFASPGANLGEVGALNMFVSQTSSLLSSSNPLNFGAASSTFLSQTAFNNQLTMNAGVAEHITTVVASTYNILSTDKIIMASSTGAASTYTLPLAASVPLGQTFEVCDLSDNAATRNITVTSTAPDTMFQNGNTSVAINSNGACDQFTKASATRWKIR